MLKLSYQNDLLEAGCDEAGRGCLCGPVFAAAVILPPDFTHPLLDDSKKLSERKRDELRLVIEENAMAWAVASVDNRMIDKINILNASILAMHKALAQLPVRPEFIVVDGNRFKPFKSVPHKTVIKGDGLYMNIAAASVLAKTHRDDFIKEKHHEYPQYNWLKNKGYGTREHVRAIDEFGLCEHHRLSFKLKKKQLDLFPR